MRAAAAFLLAALPSALKIPLYRLLYGYRIGRDVKIGFGTVLVGVRHCRIGNHVRIGPLNAFVHVGRIEIGSHARIGYLNVFRGGRQLRIGPYASILRLNVLNSILQSDVVNPVDPVLNLGAGVVLTTGHWLDFTDRIVVGPHCVIGGRGSSFWTHSRQRTRPIRLGPHCYFGSGVLAAPGVEVAASCIVSLGSVLTGRFGETRWLIAGNPAQAVRPLRPRDLFLVTRTTRNDAPHAVGHQLSAVSRQPDAQSPRTASGGPPPALPPTQRAGL